MSGPNLKVSHPLMVILVPFPRVRLPTAEVVDCFEQSNIIYGPILWESGSHTLHEFNLASSSIQFSNSRKQYEPRENSGKLKSCLTGFSLVHSWRGDLFGGTFDGGTFASFSIAWIRWMCPTRPGQDRHDRMKTRCPKVQIDKSPRLNGDKIGWGET